MKNTFETFKEVVAVVEADGYKARYNETLGNWEFVGNDEVIAVYDDGDYESMTNELKDEFSYLF